MSNIYILGGHQTDFARNWTREELGPLDMIRECIEQGLSQASLEASDVEVCHIGNFTGELFFKQGVLGGLVAEAIPAFRGIPTNRHEAACASGSMAALAALADLKAGFYDVACVFGMELMRNVDGASAADFLATAAWAGHEAQTASYCWPYMFNQVHQEYDRRYGVDKAHLDAIARNNFNNAKRNPNAQSRKWQFDDRAFSSDDEFNPVIEGHVRRQDCSQITDGASCVFLATEEYAKDYAAKRGTSLAQLPCIKGWGHSTSRIDYAAKVQDSADQSHVFPHVADTIQAALKRANMADVWAVDGIETHDCFSISEYMAIDHFGLTAPGENFKAVEEEWIMLGNRMPINASGGLIGCGHPVGATGVRMLLDAYKQTTQQAGDYQIENARNIATLNIGGSATAVASFIVGLQD